MNKEMIEFATTILNKPDARVTLLRTVTMGEPSQDMKGDLFASYEAGKTLYMIVSIGPTEPETEKRLEAAFDPDEAVQRSASDE